MPESRQLRRSLRQAAGLLGVGVLCAGLAALQQERLNAEQVAEELDTLAQRSADQLVERVRRFEYGLRGVRGAILTVGVDGITHERFRAYHASRDIDREFPGARGFGFIRRVPREQEAAFTAAARRDGRPGFEVHSLAPHEGPRYVIQYIEPVERNDQAVGLDIASEAQRRAAADRAAHSGQAAITGPITLVQATGRPLHAFLILLPIYRGDPATLNEVSNDATREAATFGWAYTPLVMDEVIAGFEPRSGEFTLRLFDTSAPEAPVRFYGPADAPTLPMPAVTSARSAGTAPAHDAARLRHVHRAVFGRDWLVELHATPAFVARLNQTRPETVFAVGAFTSLLLAALLYAHLVNRSRVQLIRSHRARMTTLLENSSDAIIAEALDGRLTAWNRAAERIFGRTAAEVLGRPCPPLLLPPDRHRSDQQRRELVLQGDPVAPVDEVLLRSDGSEIEVSMTVAPITASDGHIVGIGRTIRDISERKSAERQMQQFTAALERQVAARTSELAAALREHQALLGTIQSHALYSVTDPRGQITDVNDNFCRISGYRREELVGRTHRVVNSGTHDAGHWAGLWRTIAAGQVWRGEICNRTKDGALYWVDSIIAPFFDEQGRIERYVSIRTDITARREAEAARAAQRAAEAASAAKSAFLATMSHEMRTPLNALIGLSHLLEGSRLDAEQRDCLTKIQIAGRSLLGVINAVLDLAKIEAGEMTLEHLPFDLRALLDEVVALLTPQAVAKRLTLELHTATPLPAWVRGDAARLRQILINLTGNAIKFTEQGRVEIHVAPATVDDHGHDQGHGGTGPDAGRPLLRFTVRDTGIGIAAQDQARLFEPFVQADASTSRRFGGSGLGLSIVRHLAQMMGGEVGMHSRLGEGSAFWVQLPLEPAAPGSTAASEPGGPSGPISARGFTLLIGHADAAQRQALVELARTLGWQAEALADGAAAVARQHVRATQGVAADALLIEWPAALGHTGPPELATLAALDASADPAWRPPVVVCGSEPGLADEALAARVVDAVLRLPAEVPDLFNAVSQAVARREGCAARVLQASRLETGAGRWLAGLRVLVVDDSAINLEVAERILAREGAQVATCTSGEAAIERLRAAPAGWDAVLMDVQMPQMDGHEATRRIRHDLGLTELPVIALTAGVLTAERQHALDKGMDDFIGKPLDPRTLVLTLRRHVERVRGSPLPLTARAGRSPRRLLTEPRASRDAAQIPPIEGIDQADLLTRLGSDARLFATLLRQVLRDFAVLADLPSSPPGQPRACLPSEPERLPALLHKLRGSAGMLGAVDVARLAGAAEQAMRSGDDPGLDAALQALATGLRCLRDASAEFLARHAEPDDEAPADGPANAPPLHTEDLRELAELLRRQDLAALDRFQILSPALRGAWGAERYRRARAAVDELQFRQALEVLEEGASGGNDVSS
ncbi:PAS domain-containing hybrid sensor histidine kinase/response regulator [Sphaerotilus microaerophilus]|uniref:histidine kinase n=1 Tax=Sphaerotilus microaerophilus TaxID=2914710 RepID=A0ABM7YGX0_9BURK|nr:CHASE domain-containing protein [Sphaerotilus sp. FB-5]BDI03557.1 histidine kinase [Sphaerotilus sp. FB-5]